MNVQQFIDELARRLRDVNHRQWSESVLIDSLNSAFGALCQTIPDAYVVHRDVALAAGSEQSIPSDTDKLVRVLHNVNPINGQAQRAVREVDMGALDAAHPQWRQDAPRGYIRHWMSDTIERNRFHVWPPVDAVPDPATLPTEPTDPGPLPTTTYSTPGSKPAWASVVNGSPVANWNDEQGGGNPTYMLTNFLANAQAATSGVTAVGDVFYIDNLQAQAIFTPELDKIWWVNDAVIEVPATYPMVVGYGYYSAHAELYDFDVVWSAGIDNTDEPRPRTFFRVVELSQDGKSGTLEAFHKGSIANATDWEGVAWTDYADVPTQAEIDAQQALIDQYQIDLAAYNQAVADASAVTVRATFQAVPELTGAEGDPPVVPDEPVDPGPIATATFPHFGGDSISDGNGAAHFITNNNLTFRNQTSYFTLSTNSDGDMTSAGVYYWETVIDDASTSGPEDIGVGILDITASDFTYLGINADSIGIYENGQIYDNGAGATLSPFGDGDVICHWLDIGGSSYQIRKNDESWVEIKSSGFAPLYRAAATSRNNSIVTLVVDAANFNYAVPTGASPLKREAVTQADIDQYQLDLTAYNAAVQALADYNAGVLDLTVDMPIDRRFYNALWEWCMYYCYGIDDEGSPNTARANRHYLAFFQLLNKEDDTKALLDVARAGDEP